MMKKLFTILILLCTIAAEAQIKFSDLLLYNGNMNGAYSVGYVGSANRKFDLNTFVRFEDSTKYLTKAWYKKGMDSLAAYLTANYYTKAQADARYLQSFTEVDPTVSSVIKAITSGQITNWNTAYTWGNHAGLYRPISYVPAFADVTGKPTTLSGYGITDAQALLVSGTNIKTINGTPLLGSGNISISGSGSGVDNDADSLAGQPGPFYLNASNINAGTLNTSRLPAAGIFTTSVTTPGYYIGSTLVLGQSGGNIYYQAPSGSHIWNNVAGTGQTLVLNNAGNLSATGTVSGSSLLGADVTANAATAPTLFFGTTAQISRRGAGILSLGNGTRDNAGGTLLLGTLTATGQVTGANLSGTNTGDQDLTPYVRKTDSTLYSTKAYVQKVADSTEIKFSGADFTDSAGVITLADNSATVHAIVGERITAERTATATLANKTLTNAAYTTQNLTDGATITWNSTNGTVATVTLAGNRTLSITNPVANTYYQLTITQDGTGNRTIALPSGSKVIDGGSGSVTLSTTAAAKDIITAWYDGTNYYWNIGKNYN